MRDGKCEFDWRASLLQSNTLSGEQKKDFPREILGMLQWCERHRKWITRENGREYFREELRRRTVSAEEYKVLGIALGWYFDEREKSQSIMARERGLASEIPVNHEDVSNVWVQALVRALREKHLMLRTEQSYLGWLKRYLSWLSGTEPKKGEAWLVGKFLSDLVVVQKVAPATQKQALNALAFFWKEVIQEKDADFGPVKRGPERRRIPTVLTRDEIRQLLANLQNPYRLMAAMAYGGGLRVNELLRLRMKDVDPERRTVIIRGGKGDKDRVTPLAVSLISEVVVQRKWVEELYRLDRGNEVPGVYLPEALERKYPSAGKSLSWMWFFPAPRLMNDPRSGIRRRHHILDTTFQAAVRRAAECMGSVKRVTPHVLRHSFATHLLEGGTDLPPFHWTVRMKAKESDLCQNRK